MSSGGAAAAVVMAAVVTAGTALVPAVVPLVLVTGPAGSTDTVGWAVLVLVLAASRALVSCSTWLSGGLPGLPGWPGEVGCHSQEAD